MARNITAEVDSYFKDKDEERPWQFLRIESEAKGETLRTVIGTEQKARLYCQSAHAVHDELQIE